MKKRLVENIKMILVVISALTVFSGGLYKVWSMEAKVEKNTVEVASIGDETRKLSLKTRMWRVDDRIDYVERKLDETRDDYYKHKLEELNNESDCLEKALDIKHKWPRDCRP